jgi:hypothetical protein
MYAFRLHIHTEGEGRLHTCCCLDGHSKESLLSSKRFGQIRSIGSKCIWNDEGNKQGNAIAFICLCNRTLSVACDPEVLISTDETRPEDTNL